MYFMTTVNMRSKDKTNRVLDLRKVIAKMNKIFKDFKEGDKSIWRFTKEIFRHEYLGKLVTGDVGEDNEKKAKDVQ